MRLRFWSCGLAAVLLVACWTPFGVYHKVQPGQTLYRISDVYGVPLDKLTKLNRIDDPRTLKPGDLVFVPGATRTREVPSTAGSGERATASRTTSKPSPGKPEVTRIPSQKKSKVATRRKDDAPAMRWPVRGKVTGPFGRRGSSGHDGIDISASIGTPIKAVADGRVIYSGDELRGYGNLVIVRHTGCWATVYAHNDENLVGKGDFVTAGQEIARVGETGRTSGPHLHFEVRCGKSPKNPLHYLPAPGS